MEAKMSAPEKYSAVEEMPGLYAPFTFSERLLQRLWARGEFDAADARTADGRVVEILEPGKWNRLGGPDFRGARLRLGGAEIRGDVELHLRAEDWAAHAHARDPAYGGVVLHVVLFPPAETFTTGAGGAKIPLLVLLPLLHRGLEEYAEEEAVEALAGRPIARAPAELAALGAEALTELLARHAERRWRRKVHFAAQRIARLGWEGACHHAALEILGHRFNRAPMLATAGQFPLAAWAAGAAADEAWAVLAGRWQTHGVRPVNQPRARLRQYAAWVVARPDWPARLRALAGALPHVLAGGAARAGALRRAHQLPALRKKLSAVICADAVGGPRFDTLMCDGFLPLLTAAGGGAENTTAVGRDSLVHASSVGKVRATGTDGADADLGGLWQIWFPGDLPEALPPALRALGVFVAPARPACHGPAQGLLGWLLERETTTNRA
jgi:hypothetical protein